MVCANIFIHARKNSDTDNFFLLCSPSFVWSSALSMKFFEKVTGGLNLELDFQM